MRKLLARIDSLSDHIGRAVAYLIPILALVEVYEVVARYVFNAPTIWACELSSMLFGVFILLGGAYTLHLGGHVNMDIVYNRLSVRGRAIMSICTFPLFLVFMGVLLWKGWEMAWRSLSLVEHDSTQWGPPLYPFKLMLPLGALLLLLQGVAKLARDIGTLMGDED
ncbi:MAG: TRAP transporter small permease subunit [Proteobacteria bacterium]|nr:TRAP transporter small permease subunit [Pseudomonadota bacterium]MBU4385329.1 TRAP transporter small permease subunit [Pseudomonadota bacterium]MBU4604331.1 TRAP transporter small permease subunit [Pseudomonadota bacterium]MCG2764541.1 TRAP transporter small permease subunit [Desulfarculaceae bacterium]